MVDPHPRFILASGSASRRNMLAAAGLTFEIVPANIDERTLAAEVLRAGVTMRAPLGHLEAVAERLAGEKALEVSGRRPDALVIGADQTLGILTADPTRYAQALNKPATVIAAREQLAELRGRTHVLTSGVALACNGAIVWRHRDQARLTMRSFSDAFLDGYLAAAGATVTGSVGAYQLEGLGIQLFDRIEGDYFTILGLPLLPLLAELRQRGVLAG